ncbi:MAG: hypothetical protein HF982_06335 [Desulfobacteraceae bacterium]|nr:hypothetical protein [Desulfobacteraceae bacterium]MBC2719193.1 hypothetical protein [Desulfobacteraceae bacterium]
MKSTRRGIFLVFTMAFILSLSLTIADVGTIKVPEHYPSIQAGLNAAIEGTKCSWRRGYIMRISYGPK